MLVGSNNMLVYGRQKVAAAGFSAESVRLIMGDAQDLASTLAADVRFDAATMAFAIRNVPNRLKALKSIASHLKPGARLAILGACPSLYDCYSSSHNSGRWWSVILDNGSAQ